MRKLLVIGVTVVAGVAVGGAALAAVGDTGHGPGRPASVSTTESPSDGAVPSPDNHGGRSGARDDDRSDGPTDGPSGSASSDDDGHSPGGRGGDDPAGHDADDDHGRRHGGHGADD